MAYVIFDNDAPTGSAHSKIAANASLRDKMFPEHMQQFYTVYEVSDDDYNSLRLGNKTCTHDGTNISFEDENNTPFGGATLSPLTEAQLLEHINDYTNSVRKYFENWETSNTTKTDWLNYADSVDNLDYSTFSGRKISVIIESNSITFRSLAELPVKIVD